ncbi:MAG: hypothetical protein HY903_21155 [Deltaproteobacteria bacterium]|nr:hypothetical protein [Deltaproteobacteria bacterium]
MDATKLPCNVDSDCPAGWSCTEGVCGSRGAADDRTAADGRGAADTLPPKLAVGVACGAASECASDACECADPACAGRLCAELACDPCEHLDGGLQCTPGLGVPDAVDDPDRCDGVRSCYAGLCKVDVAGPCLVADDCGIGQCECGDATCSADGRRCSTVACDACRFTSTGAACDGTTDPGVGCDDSELCTHTDQCDADGKCAGTLITCTSYPGQCRLQQSCNGTSACTETYPGTDVDCDDLDGCTADDHCDGAGGCASGSPVTGTCVVVNSQTGRPCTALCTDRGRTCASIGVDAAGTNGAYRYYYVPNEMCVAGSGTCATVMYDNLPGTTLYACDGFQIDWTRCRCQ